jgi:hypothetical protein
VAKSAPSREAWVLGDEAAADLLGAAEDRYDAVVDKNETKSEDEDDDLDESFAPSASQVLMHFLLVHCVLFTRIG